MFPNNCSITVNFRPRVGVRRRPAHDQDRRPAPCAGHDIVGGARGRRPSPRYARGADPRRARAAAYSMIPTSTGAARAVGLVLPELKGKLDGTSVRVPTANVSIIDLTFTAKRKTTVEEINTAITKAANKAKFKNILITNEEPLVSSDFNHNSASSIFDLTQTQVIEGKLCRIASWYDNEWGFSNRMSDTAVMMSKLG